MADNKTTEQKVYPPIVIRLTNRVTTRWVLEGTENTPNPIFRESPSLYRIMPESQMMTNVKWKRNKKGEYLNEQDEIVDEAYKIPETYSLISTRHITACETISPEKQKEQGREFDQARDSIWLPEGTATIKREGNMIGTYDYIMSYQGNKNNPMRPPEAEIEFELVVASEIAKEKNVDFGRKLKAMSVIGKIRLTNEDDDEIPNYSYDEKQLEKMTRLFRELDAAESDEEKFHMLSIIAETDPDRILNSIADSRNEVLMIVKRGLELRVLSITDEKAFIVGSSEDKNTVILPFDRPFNATTRQNKLVAYLQEADGALYLAELGVKIQAKLTENLGSK